MNDRATSPRANAAGSGRTVDLDVPWFVPARRHRSRLWLARLSLGLVVLLSLIMAGSAWFDPDLGWQWFVGAAGCGLLGAVITMKSFRLGVAFEPHRIGQRRSILPGSIWVDLDRIEMALPTIIRGHDSFRRPSGLEIPGRPDSVSLSLCARDQGPRRPFEWMWRFRVRRQHRDLLETVEARTGRLRVLTIDLGDYAPADALVVVRCFMRRLPGLAATIRPVLVAAVHRSEQSRLRASAPTE